MYIILGTDQKDYGPVTSDKLRQWIAEGRANGQSQVKVEGAADWQSLGSLPEFAADLIVKSRAAPPSLTTFSAEPKTSGMAVASLVCGILGLFTCVTAPVGLVLGLVARSRIKKSQGQLTGAGLATAGIMTSSILIVLFLVAVLAGLLIPALSKASQKAHEIQSMNNMRQLALGVRIYASDHDGQFPPSATWCDAIQSLVGSPKVYQHPAQLSQRCSYAYNQKVAELNETNVAGQTVVIFESDAGWNGAGGVELLVSRQKGVNVGGRYKREEIFLIGLADGSIERVPRSQVNTLRWEP